MQKTFKIDLCVSSKLYDLVAETAKSTLQEMGYKEISDILREICYSFKIKAKDRNEGEGIVKTMVEKTPFFVNPNKDIARIGIKKEGVISAIIFYLDDKRQESIKNSLRHQGFDILDVLRQEVWHFSFLIPKERQRAFLREIITSKSPTSGLLANLNSQGYKICR